MILIKALFTIVMFSSLIQCAIGTSEVVLTDDLLNKDNDSLDQGNGNLDQGNSNLDQNNFYEIFKKNLIAATYIGSKNNIVLAGNQNNITTIKSCRVTIEEKATGLHLGIEENSNRWKKVYETSELKIISPTEAIADGGGYAQKDIISGRGTWSPIMTKFTVKIDNGKVLLLDSALNYQCIALKNNSIIFPENATTKADFEAFFNENLTQYEWQIENNNQIYLPSQGLLPLNNVKIHSSKQGELGYNKYGDNLCYSISWNIIDYVSIHEATLQYNIMYDDGINWEMKTIVGSLFLTEKGLYLFSTNNANGVNHVLSRGRRK